MAVFEVSEEGLRRTVDAIRVPCEGCGEPAVQVMRCRTFPAAHRLTCASCLAQLEVAIALLDHVHCPACPAVGRTVHDIHEFIDI